MPSADGKIRGISVPSVPWHETKHFENQCICPLAGCTAHMQSVDQPAPKPQGKP